VRLPLPEAAYAAALLWELKTRAPSFAAAPLGSIYFGGGTPSKFAPQTIGRLIASSRAIFSVRPDLEVTLEANPESVTPKKLAGFRAAGVNRLSLGVQSFRRKRLALLGRLHSAGQARSAARAARAAGFTNLSLDMIFAIPGQTLPELAADLDRALALEPDHLSVYELTWEKDTELERARQRGELQPAAEELAAEMFLRAAEKLAAAGLARYEVSNFARPGFECRHNLSGWALEPYLGLGAAAHSLMPSGERQANVAEVGKYLDQVRKTGQAVSGSEPPDPERERREFIFLGLRTAAGISLADYQQRFGRELPAEKAEVIQSLQALKLISLIKRGRLRLTPKGFLLADAATLELI
jgi:oxygen-independent coproporphyrinogen-3 oxidase